MAEPIYKLFMGRFSEAWYQLSKEEQNSLIAKLNWALEKVGGKRPLLCDSVLGSMVVCRNRGVPEHRGGPKVHGGSSRVELVPILREYERVGNQIGIAVGSRSA